MLKGKPKILKVKSIEYIQIRVSRRLLNRIWFAKEFNFFDLVKLHDENIVNFENEKNKKEFELLIVLIKKTINKLYKNKERNLNERFVDLVSKQ
ncbi:hypothetical protein KAH94_06215 [bacterium]|nr:hypothetical protein [bacterium]